MTPEQIQQIVINHWMTYFRKETLRLTPQEIQRQSKASARLSMREMEALQGIGLDPKTAWSEASRLFLTAPPSPEEIADEQAELKEVDEQAVPALPPLAR